MRTGNCETQSPSPSWYSSNIDDEEKNIDRNTSKEIMPISEICQPRSFRQTAAQIAAERSAWCQPPAPHHKSYLVIDSKSYDVPFPTVCFDQNIELRHDSPLPFKYWAKNIFSTFTSTTYNILTLSFRQLRLGVLLEPSRWKSLWCQGNFQLCAGKRSAVDVDTIVLHWDGCNSSAQMYYTLRQLGLSAHLLIDSDATVYQMLDLGTDKAFHAGWINNRSIGIEISNPIDPTAGTSTPRQIIRDIIPNLDKPSFYYDFTEAQKQRTCEVIDFLNEHFSIPKVVPVTIDSSGLEAEPKLVGQTFSGICGHYHISKGKHDPGLSFWPRLRAHWSLQRDGSQQRVGCQTFGNNLTEETVDR